MDSSSSSASLRGPLLPEGWVQLMDATYATPYYYHAAQGITQWEHPGAAHSSSAAPPPMNMPAGYGQPALVRPAAVPVVYAPQQQHQQVQQQQYAQPAAVPPQRTQTALVPPRNVVNTVDYNTGYQEPHQESVQQGSFTTTDGAAAVTLDTTTASAAVAGADTRIAAAASEEQPPPQDTAYVPVPSSKKKQKLPKLTHDYEHLANLYRMQRVYMAPEGPLKCVLCRERNCTDVLFPCQHRCVCPECIVMHQVCEHQHMNLVRDGHFNCPLCGEIIKRIIPSAGGAEENEYWEWVLAVKPPLPEGFMKNFRHSAAVIEKVYVRQDKTENEPSRLCAIS